MEMSKWTSVMPLTEQTTVGDGEQGGVNQLQSRLGQEKGAHEHISYAAKNIPPAAFYRRHRKNCFENNLHIDQKLQTGRYGPNLVLFVLLSIDL